MTSTKARRSSCTRLAKAEVRERFLRAGTPVVERGPEEFAAFIKSENERWLPLINSSGARIE